MKIEKKTVTKYQLSKLDALDPVTVICEDIGPRQGKIIIECYGKSWSAYWGGMGERTIAEFFCSCDEHYLAGKLSSITSMVTDYDQINDELSALRIDLFVTNEIEVHMAYSTLAQLYGERLEELPETNNPEYSYLCRIILAVKEALKTEVDVKSA